MGVLSFIALRRVQIAKVLRVGNRAGSVGQLPENHPAILPECAFSIVRSSAPNFLPLMVD